MTPETRAIRRSPNGSAARRAALGCALAAMAGLAAATLPAAAGDQPFILAQNAPLQLGPPGG
ncbi:MAG: hypothetical protein ACT6XY_15585, partial [Phreatobacter sp.]|uniref:hypothetical protein n=1 Tax=Phreatobacter sp. TaxID=1966341 RepID=UPI004036D377